MKVKIVNKSGFDLPKYATIGSAGLDIRSVDDIWIHPMQRIMVHSGLYIQLPEGYEAQIRCRSGLAIKNGISVINGIGTIDSDYTGEVCVLLVNLSNENFHINFGDRIAQMVINKYEKAEWDEVNELIETDRGSGGFSSTGLK
jgi:dUTP pyrophosphatase